jgi:hypothetical protein
MPTFTEILPATKTSKHNGIEWTPESIGSASGLLVIRQHGKGKDGAYRVTERPCDWAGRAFHFEKIGGGTDPDATSYDVLIGQHDRRCDCKGFTRHGHCRHTEAILAILENEFLWSRPAAPVCESTEDDMPECFRGIGSAPGADCPF